MVNQVLPFVFQRKRRAAKPDERQQPSTPPFNPDAAAPSPATNAVQEVARRMAERPLETPPAAPAPSAPREPLQTVTNEAGESVAPMAPDEQVQQQTRPRFQTPPLVTEDERGRPARSIHSPDSPEREKAYREAVGQYEPQRAEGWKDRLLPLIARMGLGAFLRTGDPLAGAGGALTGLATGLIDPKANDRMWRQREMAGSDARTGNLREQRKAELEEQEARAGIGLKNAQADYYEARPDILREQTEARIGQTERRLDIMETQGNRRLEQGERRLGQGERRLDLSERAQKTLDEFRRSKMYNDNEQRERDRQVRVSEGEKNRTAANARSANAQAGADRRSAAAQAGADRRALAGRRFALGRLLLQAEKEGRTLEEVVREVQEHGGEWYDENK